MEIKMMMLKISGSQMFKKATITRPASGKICCLIPIDPKLDFEQAFSQAMERELEGLEEDGWQVAGHGVESESSFNPKYSIILRKKASC